MEVRNTVITAEQEKEFVRRALEDEEDELGVSPQVLFVYIQFSLIY